MENNNFSNEKLEIRRKVTDLLINLGITANLKGYNYIREAILLILDDSIYIDCVTKKLYPTIATKFDTTPSRVERAIRHAIEVAFSRGDADTMKKYLGYTLHQKRGKLTNSEFIATLVDLLSFELC